jgi:hypothetical protein
MKITVVDAHDQAKLAANVRHAHTLKLPRIVEQKIHGRALALVGGGPSVVEHLDEIRAFDDVWAINEAAAWLKGHGIDACMFSIDPGGMEPEFYDVNRAILATCSPPEVFEALKGRDVRVFDTRYGGPTSASRAPPIALKCGFGRVTFFGLEGSFRGKTHAYKDFYNQGQMIVRSCGIDFLTQPDYFQQCEYFAGLVRDHPKVFAERSGGLLGAMSLCGHWDVIAVSKELLRSA